MIGIRLEVSERALNIILQIVYVESICMYMYTEPLLHSTSFLALGSAGTNLIGQLEIHYFTYRPLHLTNQIPLFVTTILF